MKRCRTCKQERSPRAFYSDTAKDCGPCVSAKATAKYHAKQARVGLLEDVAVEARKVIMSPDCALTKALSRLDAWERKRK